MSRHVRTTGQRDDAWSHPEDWECEPDHCGAPSRRGPVVLLLAMLAQAKYDVRRLNTAKRMCGLRVANPFPKSANRAGQGMLQDYRQKSRVAELQDFFESGYDQRIVDILQSVGCPAPHARKYREALFAA